MVAAGVFVQASGALRACFRYLADDLLGNRILLHLDSFSLFIELDAMLVLFAGLAIMHRHLTDNAMAIFAELAGEDVAVFFGREEAAPAALCARAGTELFITLAAFFRSLVQPANDVSFSSSCDLCY